jgi:positive regulator of sigma E activity
MKSKHNLIIFIFLAITVVYLILSDQEVWLIPFIFCLVAIGFIGKRYQKFFESSLWKAVLLIMLIISVFGIGSYLLITKVFGVQSLF